MLDGSESVDEDDITGLSTRFAETVAKITAETVLNAEYI